MSWLIDIIDRQRWVADTAPAVQSAIRDAWGGAGERGRMMQDALHGRWLGHPLHPMLTDVTIGFWMTASFLDVLEGMGQRSVGRAADISTAVGLLSTVPTALAGATDWQHASGRAQRSGLVHAGLNNMATALYGMSLVHRLRGNRGKGRGLSLAGLGVLGVSGYIGGSLSYDDRMGMSHLPAEEPPREFTPVLLDSELVERAPRRVEAAGYPLLLVRLDGQIHAMASVCAHMGGPLEDGTIEDGCIVCPWHGSRFALAPGADGELRAGPSVYSQPALETRVLDGRIEVRAPTP